MNRYDQELTSTERRPGRRRGRPLEAQTISLLLASLAYRWDQQDSKRTTEPASPAVRSDQAILHGLATRYPRMALLTGQRPGATLPIAWHGAAKGLRPTCPRHDAVTLFARGTKGGRSKLPRSKEGL